MRPPPSSLRQRMLAAVPASLSAFIGRDHAIAAILRLLDETRLLTLTGAGGSGKTRLASEVARRSATSYPDGVIWVELAPLQDAALLTETVLAAIGVEQGSRAALTVLLDVLRDRNALLVLDNCEHLVGAAAALVETLLLAAPGLRVLATSREPLGIGGEQAWLVPGLTLPGADAAPAAVADAESVQLFVDRARSASATFRITPANAPAIARIARRLDGLPLAIELAAARVRSLTPEQLAERLDDVFNLLTSGARTAVARHRTLRGAIDWSYRLLDARERLLLQRLSVFAGDVAIEQIEAVCSGDGLDQPDILDTVAALVDKSLVVVREADGMARYQLLETIRQFAHEKLTESGEATTLAARHARAYVALVDEAAPHFITRERPSWVARVQRELDNVRIALATTRERDPAVHVRLAGKLGWFWYSSGLWTEGRRWSEGAIASGGGSAERAAVLLGVGVIASLQADSQAAVAWLRESAAISGEIGDHSTESYALAYVGVAYAVSGDDAQEPTERALAWFEGAGDLYGLRLAHVVLSTHFLLRGDLAAARRHAESGARIARAFGLDRELAIALQVYGLVVLTAGDLSQAGTLFREAIAALRQDPSTFWIARALELLGIVSCRLGDPRRGVLFLGAADACRASIGAAQFEHDRRRLDPVILDARETLGGEEFARTWTDGRTRALTESLATAVEPLAPTVDVTESASATISERVAAPALEVHALGSLVILRDGVRLSDAAWRYARPRELLLYLLTHPEGCTREQIGLVFWPDSSAAQVKNSFHVTLHHLRKALGAADLIAFDDDRYRVRWELDVRFDARELADVMRPAIRAVKGARAGADVAEPLGRIWRATESYRGDFLQDEDAGDWHLETRDHLRRLYADGLLLIGEHLERAEDHAGAAEIYRRIIAVDELSEEAHRRLMQCLARSGDRAEALRQYERLAGMLRKDLEAEPEGETRALFDRLRRAERV
ncbi:MAG: BTAD domain-containing putative transcriptional regulator [Gemmatimonadaceae bacterium]